MTRVILMVACAGVLSAFVGVLAVNKPQHAADAHSGSVEARNPA